MPTSSTHQAARAPLPTMQVTEHGAVDTSFPAIEAHFPNGVRLLPGVRYWTKEGFRPLTLDLYLPSGRTARQASSFPLIMFIHGGGWLRGESRWSRPIRNFPGLLADIAARGYVVTSIDYRLSGEALWPAQGRDVKAAIRFLRLHADEYGIDPEHFGTWGVSAGGHLSAVAAATAGVEALQPEDGTISGISDAVQAAASWYGGFNMESIAGQARAMGGFSRDDDEAPEWRLLGCSHDRCPPDRLRSASPVSYVRRDMAPMLLIAGDQDKLIPHLQAIEMAERMKAVDASVELLILPGIGHDFAGYTLEATRAANQMALERTLLFFDRMLYRAP